MLRNTLAFLTVIPIGMDEKAFDDAARLMWLFPLYGGFIGLIAGGLGLGLTMLKVPHLAVAVLVYACLAGITGFNHLDGLIDFADAVAAPVSRERRLQILKDQYTGAAAVVTCITTALLTVAFLNSAPTNLILQAAMMSEATAKLGMVISAAMGPSASTGMGHIFVKALRDKMIPKLLSSIMLTLAFTALLGVAGIIALLGGLLASVSVTGVARRRLGGVTGDVMGSVNELSRAASLAGCVVWLNWFSA